MTLRLVSSTDLPNRPVAPTSQKSRQSPKEPGLLVRLLKSSIPAVRFALTRDVDQFLLIRDRLNGTGLDIEARFRGETDGVSLLARRPSIDSETVDYDRLRALRPTTLGGAYARFLDQNELSPDAFRATDAVLSSHAYLEQRRRQSHDLWHTLTGYGPTVLGEFLLATFSYGQTGETTGRVFSALGVMRYPHLFRAFRDAFQRGSEARFLLAVHWESRWEQTLVDVRRELSIAPCHARLPARAIWGDPAGGVEAPPIPRAVAV